MYRGFSPAAVGLNAISIAGAMLLACATTPRYTRGASPAPRPRHVAARRPAPERTPAQSTAGYRTIGEGIASYYAHAFHGKQTASGERFNMHALTAAHRSLAFGTTVRVTNLQNGKAVVVRINDRGPFKKSRIIDLSLAAAQKIGLDKTGTARVRLEAAP
jgi:rare lipoprotein A